MGKRVRSIKFQIIFIGILISVILQATLLISYYQNRKMKIEENDRHFQELITQMAGTVNDNCQDLNRLLEKIAYSSMIQEYLEAGIPLDVEGVEDMRISLLSYSELKYGIKDIAVIAENGEVVNFRGDVMEVKKNAEEIPQKEPYYYTGIQELRFNVGLPKTQCFAVGTHVYSTTDFEGDGKLGTVVIRFSPQCIFSFMQYGSQEIIPDMMVFDRNSELVFSSVSDDEMEAYEAYQNVSGENSNDSIRLNGERYYVRTGSLEMLEGKIVFLISQKELMEGVDELQFKLIIFSIGALIMVFGLCGFILYNIVKPVNDLIEYMREMEEGNLRLMKKPVQIKGATEIESMADRFNHMMGEINDLTHRLVDTTSRLYESKIEKQQAELEYMRSQINPHFLFNTLETVKGCAIDEDADKTFHMLNALGKIFRYCVRGGNEVSLAEELVVTDGYMDLQKTRFETRLTFYNEIPDEMKKISIPKMVLQPLLENAVVHGIEENNAVTIWLTGGVYEGDVELTIRDDGTSLDDRKLETLRAALEDRSETAHIGMSNVHWRLKYIFGDEYGLSIDKTVSGFQVTIRMPYRIKSDGEGADV